MTPSPAIPARRLAPAYTRLSFAGLILLGGCSWVPFTQHLVYRIDIQQGTVITQEMEAQLHPGMTREQVRFVLGTPALVDPFHANRWEYTYRMQPGRGDPIERRFTVYFDADKLARYEGDPLPTEAEFIADRIRFNQQQLRDLGIKVDYLVPAPTPPLVPTEVPTSAVPGSGPDAGPAPETPASTSSAPGSPASVSPAALPPRSLPDSSDTPATVPDAPASPSVLDRIRNLFNSSPDPTLKSTAPTSPQGPGS
jgi:outer membrane protein assembly factor BamE